MLPWLIAIFVAQCLLLTLLGWFLTRRNESAIHKALQNRGPDPGQGLDSNRVYELLTTASKALSEHAEKLETFEGFFQQTSRGAQNDTLSKQLTQMRRANQCVEQTVESTVEGLLATCGDLLSDEQSSLEAYQEKTCAFDKTLDCKNPEAVLVQIASKLLSMVHELRDENKAVRNEVAAGKDKINQLLTRASSAEQIARVDPLTQLSNRRAFDEAHAQCDELLSQCGQPFCLILLDIDHFKSVNDEFGHATGDAVLALIARILRENCKTSDHTCRLGGEEFAVLLPNCEEQPAIWIADRYREKIGAAVLHYDNRQVTVTVSCGVSQAVAGETRGRLLERADSALYTAKLRGRNRTCTDRDLATEKVPAVPAATV